MSLTAMAWNIRYCRSIAEVAFCAYCKNWRRAGSCMLRPAYMLGSNVVRGEQRDEGRRCGSLFDMRTPRGLLPIHQAHHSDDFETVLARRFDGLHGRCPGSANIVDNHHSRRFLAEALDALAGAVALLGLTH